MSEAGGAGTVSPLPPFLPPVGSGAADMVGPRPLLHAPLSPPVYLPPGVPGDPGEPSLSGEPKGVGPGDDGRQLGAPLVGASPLAGFTLAESPLADASPLSSPDGNGSAITAMDEALLAIHQVVLDLRQHAGIAASGDPSMATWFSVRRPEDSGGPAVPPAPASAIAAEAARHLEEVAQRVRAGALPLLEVAGPLREGSALALTLAALHGVRARDPGGAGRRGP